MPPVGVGRDLRLGADLRHVEGQTQENFNYVGVARTRRRIAGGEALTGRLSADAGAEVGALTLTLGGRVDRLLFEDGLLRETTIITGASVATALYPDRDGTQGTGRAEVA